MKILTIGNSFTDSLAKFFVPAVRSAGCEITFDRANHGGCELHRHWNYIENEERDGVFRMYQNYTHTMREILEGEAWDVVTIQQASHASWRSETFQPYADNLAAYVHTHAPKAELVIQQTWAYRADDPRIAPGGEWGIDQTEMYNRLTANYCALAKRLSCRVIPTGYAVQLARTMEAHPFVNYDPALLNTLSWPDLPPQAGDVVGAMNWRKDKNTGTMRISRDLIHLNVRGQYLQACVWFAFLYGRPVSGITLRPDELSDGDALFLQSVAQNAVDGFKF